jgi:tRNA A37 threonylcarbamoyladenosine synthetase subunit TsaC/SUA5/YrdC
LVIIPLISLSNVSKVKNYLNKKKINFKTILKEDWPLPYSLINKHKKNLIKLKKKRLINYKEKYGMFLAYTEILLLKL